MKRYFYILALATLSVLKVNAQSVTYKTTLDDPYDVKALQVHLVPFYMDMSTCEFD